MTSNSMSIVTRTGLAAARPSTTAMLLCGVVAGPLFLATVVIQQITRSGYDAARHPLSLLSLGELGWIQIVNFVLAGLLIIVSAMGMRRVLKGDTAGTWGPILFAAYGGAMVWGGVFVSDPSLGFPAGTPDVVPDPSTWSWHSTLHAPASPVMSIALIAACSVFARRFHRERRHGLATLTWGCAIGHLILFATAMSTGNYVFMVASGGLLFLWASGVTAHMMFGGRDGT